MVYADKFNQDDNNDEMPAGVIIFFIIASIVSLILLLTGAWKSDRCDAPQYDGTGELVNDDCINAQ